MDGYEYIDRETQELNWQESQELMLEAGFDFDAAAKESQIQEMEINRALLAAIENVDGGESIPF